MKTNLHIKLMVLGMSIFLFTGLTLSAQIEWEKYEGNPVLNEFGAGWASLGVRSPNVIFDDDTLKMWFSAEGNIGYAVSTDGISWVPNPNPVIPVGNAGEWNHHKNHPYVIRVNDTLKMWYSGSSDNFFWNISIGYAWSLDNITWNLLEDPVLEKGEAGSWEENAVYKPAIYYDGSTYKMWYNGFMGDSLTDPDRVGYATSTDGINWVKDTDHNPVMDLGDEGTFFDTWIQSSCVLFLGDEYQMWISGWDNVSLEPMRYLRIGYATSPDGIEWTVQNDSMPVLDVGSSTSWEKSRVTNPTVIVHENQYKMWYAGFDYYTYRIGHATNGYVGQNEMEESGSNSGNIIVYPNPASTSANLQYTVYNIQNTKLLIYDAYGRLVETLVDEVQHAGKYNITWNAQGLPAGVYFYRLIADEKVASGKIIKR